MGGHLTFISQKLGEGKSPITQRTVYCRMQPRWQLTVLCGFKSCPEAILWWTMDGAKLRQHTFGQSGTDLCYLIVLRSPINHFTFTVQSTCRYFFVDKEANPLLSWCKAENLTYSNTKIQPSNCVLVRPVCKRIILLILTSVFFTLPPKTSPQKQYLCKFYALK